MKLIDCIKPYRKVVSFLEDYEKIDKFLNYGFSTPPKLKGKKVNGCSILRVVNFSDLNDDWSVGESGTISQENKEYVGYLYYLKNEDKITFLEKLLKGERIFYLYEQLSGYETMLCSKKDYEENKDSIVEIDKEHYQPLKIIIEKEVAERLLDKLKQY